MGLFYYGIRSLDVFLCYLLFREIFMDIRIHLIIKSRISDSGFSDFAFDLFHSTNSASSVSSEKIRLVHQISHIYSKYQKMKKEKTEKQKLVKRI